MPVSRGQNFTQVELNIVGSSVFGKYPKINSEKTYNMFISDNFLVPYSGYEIAILNTLLANGKEGRGIFTSTKFGDIVVVIDNQAYFINIAYDQQTEKIIFRQIIPIGTLTTVTGPVYIAENNRPQIGISDGSSFYVYDPTLSPSFQNISLNFTPGYLTFHDTYFILAASNDQTYTPPANNTWRLSNSNDGTTWPSTANNVGLLQSKPDNVQAVVRFPSKGNMIFVMGSITTEAWFNTGAQLFPYQRTNQFNIDYGCISPATVAYMDEIVVWLAQNEKSGPIIMYSDGGMPKKITTDGIDQLFSQLQNPADSQAFLYRQDGHLFYHINFYQDNLSLYYDFNTEKFYHACDQNLNYFIAAEICFYKNQYYFVSKNTGNIYSFDTIFTTYQDTMKNNVVVNHEIPRFRTCRNIRLKSQDYFILNDVGFTIESGETPYQQEDLGQSVLITQDGQYLITQGVQDQFITQDGEFLVDQSNSELYFVAQQTNPSQFSFLISQQDDFAYLTPRVDFSISIDGGATFGQDMPYWLPALGHRKNRLMWWQGGLANDLVCQFKFWGIGRFVATSGEANVRI